VRVLYHFSDDPGIAQFEPRPPLQRPDVRPLVWAIDEWHAPMYCFPRDCPRILFWPLPTTTAEDRARWWGDREARMVACTEWSWLPRMAATTLYRYTLPADAFEDLGDAGMFVSREAAIPLAVEPVSDLIGALRDVGVELRLMPSLLPLRGAWDTTMHVSGIRLRNAAGWEPGPEGPLPPAIAPDG
jgi:hypothetical protein